MGHLIVSGESAPSNQPHQYPVYFVDVDEIPLADTYDTIARAYSITIRRVHKAGLNDADRRSLMNAADEAMLCYALERKAEALAVVAMILAMRELATKGDE